MNDKEIIEMIILRFIKDNRQVTKEEIIKHLRETQRINISDEEIDRVLREMEGKQFGAS